MATAPQATPQTLVDAMDASARAQKRAEQAHRDAARAARQAQDELIAFFERAGIAVERAGGGR